MGFPCVADAPHDLIDRQIGIQEQGCSFVHPQHLDQVGEGTIGPLLYKPRQVRGIPAKLLCCLSQGGVGQVLLDVAKDHGQLVRCFRAHQQHRVIFRKLKQNIQQKGLQLCLQLQKFFLLWLSFFDAVLHDPFQQRGIVADAGCREVQVERPVFFRTMLQEIMDRVVGLIKPRERLCRLPGPQHHVQDPALRVNDVGGMDRVRRKQEDVIGLHVDVVILDHACDGTVPGKFYLDSIRLVSPWNQILYGWKCVIPPVGADEIIDV